MNRFKAKLLQWISLWQVGTLVSGPLIPNEAKAAYSLWSGAVRGNTQNVGMAGALTGLADDYYGSVINPAGSAMTLRQMELDLTHSNISDQLLLTPGQNFSGQTVGIAIPLDKMGLSIGFTTPFLATHDIGEQVILRDYRFTLSKSFLENHLSLGIGIALDEAHLNSESITQVGSTFGILYRLPNRIFLGSSLNTPLLLGPFQGDRLFSLPLTATVGLGWMPNRLFRAAISAEWISTELNSFSFHQPDQQVGQSPALQIHLGASYEFLYIKNIRSKIDTGTYLEALRTSNSYRPHYTVGLTIQPWFVNLVMTLDIANKYHNTLFNLGIDVENLFRLLKLIPKKISNPPSGFLPAPLENNEDWMSEKIQDHPERDFHAIQPNAELYEKVFEKRIENLLHPSNSKN